MKSYTVYILNLIAILSLNLILSSCVDVFEEDLSDETVELIAPSDSLVYKEYNQNFWWAKVEGASKYHFQIVEGSFQHPRRLVADTNIVYEQIVFSLYPGNFEWKVKAFNGGYETQYSQRSLQIDSAALEDQFVTIKSPKSETFHSGIISFKWDPLFGAPFYILEVDEFTGNFYDPVFRDTIFNVLGSEISIARNIETSNGTFQWRVKAGESKWSVTGKFFINSTSPELSTPTPGAVNLSSPVSLTWNSKEGISLFTVLIQDSTRNLLVKTSVSDKSFSYKPEGLGNMKKFYWAVIGEDFSGVKSDTSEFRSFVIQ